MTNETLGQIASGCDIGKRSKAKYIWHACEVCGKQRWVQLIKGEPERKRCFPCSVKTGAEAYHWKGGKIHTSDGYVQIRLQADNFFFPMTIRRSRTGGYVFEHRLVMAKHLNRCLLSWEIIHHKNGIKDDNRLENLVLLSGQYKHIVDTMMKVSLRRLEAKIDSQNELTNKLYQEIRLLRWENKQLKEKVSNESNI